MSGSKRLAVKRKNCRDDKNRNKRMLLESPKREAGLNASARLNIYFGESTSICVEGISKSISDSEKIKKKVTRNAKLPKQERKCTHEKTTYKKRETKSDHYNVNSGKCRRKKSIEHLSENVVKCGTFSDRRFVQNINKNKKCRNGRESSNEYPRRLASLNAEAIISASSRGWLTKSIDVKRDHTRLKRNRADKKGSLFCEHDVILDNNDHLSSQTENLLNPTCKVTSLPSTQSKETYESMETERIDNHMSINSSPNNDISSRQRTDLYFSQYNAIDIQDNNLSVSNEPPSFTALKKLQSQPKVASFTSLKDYPPVPTEQPSFTALKDLQSQPNIPSFTSLKDYPPVSTEQPSFTALKDLQSQPNIPSFTSLKDHPPVSNEQPSFTALNDRQSLPSLPSFTSLRDQTIRQYQYSLPLFNHPHVQVSTPTTDIPVHNYQVEHPHLQGVNPTSTNNTHCNCQVEHPHLQGVNPTSTNNTHCNCQVEHPHLQGVNSTSTNNTHCNCHVEHPFVQTPTTTTGYIHRPEQSFDASYYPLFMKPNITTHDTISEQIQNSSSPPVFATKNIKIDSDMHGEVFNKIYIISTDDIKIASSGAVNNTSQNVAFMSENIETSQLVGDGNVLGNNLHGDIKNIYMKKPPVLKKATAKMKHKESLNKPPVLEKICYRSKSVEDPWITENSSIFRAGDKLLTNESRGTCKIANPVTNTRTDKLDFDQLITTSRCSENNDTKVLEDPNSNVSKYNVGCPPNIQQTSCKKKTLHKGTSLQKEKTLHNEKRLHKETSSLNKKTERDINTCTLLKDKSLKDSKTVHKKLHQAKITSNQHEYPVNKVKNCSRKHSVNIASHRQSEIKSSKETNATRQRKNTRIRKGGNTCNNVKEKRKLHKWNWHGECEMVAIHIQTAGDKLVMRKCYPSIIHCDGDVINVRDNVLLCSGPRKSDIPYVAKVAAFWEDPHSSDMMMSLLWYYRPEHTEIGRQKVDLECEVFASKHRDENSIACIEDKCHILTYNQYCRYMADVCRVEEHVPNRRHHVPKMSSPTHIHPPDHNIDIVLLCRKVYDFRQKRILKNPY